jgi:membrane protein
MGMIRTAARTFLSDLWEGARTYRASGGFNDSAAISFYALFSLIPMLLIITSVLAFVIGKEAGLLDRITVVVTEALPRGGAAVADDLREIAERPTSFGWLGVITLVWSAEFVLDSTSAALSKIFGAGARGFLRRKVVNLAVLAMAVVAATGSILVTAASRVAGGLAIGVPGIGFLYRLMQGLAFAYILPALLVAASAAFVFWMFSGLRLRLRYALCGSALFTALWEASKQFFAWYVSNIRGYNMFYGSFGAVMMLLLWIFYSANIFLFSACYASAADARGTGARR